MFLITISIVEQIQHVYGSDNSNNYNPSEIIEYDNKFIASKSINKEKNITSNGVGDFSA